MSRQKNGIIWGIDKNKLEDCVSVSASLIEVIRSLGLSSLSTSVYGSLKRRLVQENIDFSHLYNTKKFSKVGKMNALPYEKIFQIESPHGGQIAKRHLIRHSLIPYRCGICFNAGSWQDLPLSLQLDHINGTRTDHRLENLRFLCPNCHSQTATFSGKHLKKRIVTCIDCGVGISNSCTRCRSCSSKANNHKLKRFHTTKEELEDLIRLHDNLETISRIFGVTSNNIRKRCRSLGVDCTTSKALKRRKTLSGLSENMGASTELASVLPDSQSGNSTIKL